MAALLAFCAAALGQGAIQQAGPVTTNHPVAWFFNGLVGDPGSANGFNSSGTAGAGISEFLMVHGGNGTPPFANVGTGPLNTTFCMYDGPVTGANGFHYLCLDPNANGGGTLDYSFAPPASPLPFQFCINNAPCFTPGAGGSPTAVLREVASGSSDLATTADGTVAWRSATTAPKAESIYGCTTATNGKLLTIKDAIGTATLYPITVTPLSGTIENGASWPMNYNLYALTLQCEGAFSNWIII